MKISRKIPIDHHENPYWSLLYIITMNESLQKMQKVDFCVFVLAMLAGLSTEKNNNFTNGSHQELSPAMGLAWGYDQRCRLTTSKAI